MRIIEISGYSWSNAMDFYDALYAAVGGPQGLGYSIDALIDTLIYDGTTDIKPPYTIVVSCTASLPIQVREEVELAKKEILLAREEFRAARGYDVEVQFEMELRRPDRDRDQ